MLVTNSAMRMLAWGVLLLAGVTAIEDPFNIFCGSTDCYEVLNITDPASASTKDIKKAYRRMSVMYHPDKNRSPGAEERFREIAKAAEVLEDEKTREDYDYYLTHPWDYYKVTGKHYFRKLPDADIRIIIAGIVLFLSVLLPIAQHQRYVQAVEGLTQATISNLGSGGPPQTIAIFQRARDGYEAHMRKALGSKFDAKCMRMMKMQKDPKFVEIVKQMVGDMQIEGEYRKPTVDDIFAVKLLKFPYTLCLYFMCIYKRKFSPNTLSDEEKEAWAVERVTAARWNALSHEAQLSLIEKRIWEQAVFEEWTAEQEADVASKRPNAYKQYKRYMKQNPNA